MTCYVCDNPIKKNPVYITKGKHRHPRCAPGMKKWLASKVGRKSELRAVFMVREVSA